MMPLPTACPKCGSRKTMSSTDTLDDMVTCRVECMACGVFVTETCPKAWVPIVIDRMLIAWKDGTI